MVKLFHKRISQKRITVSGSWLVLIIFSFVSIQVSGQNEQIQEKEKNLHRYYGMDKLKILNDLSSYYFTANSNKGFRYAKQAAALSENIYQNHVEMDSLSLNQHILANYQLGKYFYERQKFIDSKGYLDLAQSISIQNSDSLYLNDIAIYLKEINSKIASGEVKESFFSKTLGNLRIGEVINETSTNLSISTELKMAETNEKNGDLQKAVVHYENAINKLRNLGETQRIRELQIKVAFLLDSLDQHVEAQKFLNLSLAESDTAKEAKSNIPSEEIVSKLINPDTSNTIVDFDSLEIEKQNLKDISQKLMEERNYEQSIEYLKRYQQLAAKMQADSLNAIIAQQKKEDEILLLNQQKDIADLKVEAIEREAEKQERRQKTLLIIAFIILLGTLVIIYFYFSKRREHKKLVIAYDELDETKNKLEEAEYRIVTLLKQQVSGDIAKELISSETGNPGEKRFVCVMFLDIRDFTPMAEKLSPEELISFQNKVFGFMIDIVQEYHGNINQLLGDGFMATFGAPVSHGNDCQNGYDCALKIVRKLDKKNKSGEIETTKIGIGLHAGYVVTGNVGNDIRKQYSVTGNTVIIASRVEQLNKKLNSRLLITEEVFNELEKIDIQKPTFIEENIKGRKEKIRLLIIT